MIKNRVYVPYLPTRHDPIAGQRVAAINVTPAADYGELVLMTDIKIPASEGNLPTLIKQIRAAIQSMEPDDYLVAIGDPILFGAALSYAMDHLGEVQVLRWSKVERAYQLIKITL